MYEYKCQIDRVVDGDTVDVVLDLGFSILHKARVRLYAIDTPECRTRNKDEKARGLLAKNFIVQAVNSGKNFVIQTHLKDSKGKFGRILGTLIIDDLDINEALVDNYLAVAYYGQNKNDVEVSHQINRDKLIETGLFTPITQQ
jgi:micrococcal nuclease|tara:strand:- start:397 stop:825 length:429 start_codon:yes stop_codon:yes gene_type:complete